MKPWDIIVILIIALIVGLAAFYVIRSKKKGRKCIGCPYASTKNCQCNAKKKE